jgi:XTP/dITP diphosphohydrolase
VINGVCEKLIFRHPHIYGDVIVNDEEDVKRNWEKLKLKEGKKSVLSGVPRSLPSTVKAMRLQEKAKQVGFEWDNKDQVWEKVKEEKQNCLKPLQGDSNKWKMNWEMFFLLINCQIFKPDVENALERTNKNL